MDLWSLTMCCVSLMWVGALGKDNDECKKDPSDAMRLRHDLFCGYDKTTRPVLHESDTTDLEVNFFPVFIDTTKDLNILEVHTFIQWVWTDSYLTWDSKNYNNTTGLFVDCSNVWSPNIMLYTSSGYSDYQTSPFLLTADSLCYLKPGTVMGFTPTMMFTRCSFDVSLWPFDVHNCSLSIGSQIYNKDELNLFHKHQPFLELYSENKNWELVRIDTMEHNILYNGTTYVWLRLDLILKRHAGSDKATVVIPAIVLSMLTLAILWIEVGSPERICVSIMSIVCHFLYLQYLAKKLPINSNSVPLVVYFFRDSLVLVSVALLVTVILHRLAMSSSTPPRWTSNAVKTVLSNRFGQLVLLAKLNPEEAMSVKEEADTELLTSPEPKISKEWILIATFLDRVFFLLYSMVLLALLIQFVF